MRDLITRTGYSWPVLLLTWAGLWLACYAIARAAEAPLRLWEDEEPTR
jgi:hypothetical protein